MVIKSNFVEIFATEKHIFGIITDFYRMEKILPPTVKCLERDENHIKVSVEDKADISLKILNKTEFSKVEYNLENNHKIPAIVAISVNNSNLYIEANIDVPAFLSPVIKKPLENFVNFLATAIKNEAEKA